MFNQNNNFGMMIQNQNNMMINQNNSMMNQNQNNMRMNQNQNSMMMNQNQNNMRMNQNQNSMMMNQNQNSMMMNQNQNNIMMNQNQNNIMMNQNQNNMMMNQNRNNMMMNQSNMMNIPNPSNMMINQNNNNMMMNQNNMRMNPNQNNMMMNQNMLMTNTINNNFNNQQFSFKEQLFKKFQNVGDPYQIQKGIALGLNNGQEYQNYVAGGNQIHNFLKTSSNDYQRGGFDKVNIVFAVMKGNIHSRVYQRKETVRNMLIKFIKSVGLMEYHLNNIYFLFNAGKLNSINQNKTLDEIGLINGSRITVIDLKDIIGA